MKAKIHPFQWLSILQVVISTATVDGGRPCGPPGRTSGVFFRPKLRKYADEQTVEYGCRQTELVLLGSKVRLCRDGRWQQPIPKCGELNAIDWKSV